MSVNRLLSELLAELEAGDVPDPCGQSFTLAALWADLARLAGEAPPAAVAAVAGELDTVEPTGRVAPWMFFDEDLAPTPAGRHAD